MTLISNVGPAGLWIAVLITFIQDIENPKCRADFERAREIVINRSGCFDMIATAAKYDPEGLQRRLVKAMGKKGNRLDRQDTQDGQLKQ